MQGVLVSVEMLTTRLEDAAIWAKQSKLDRRAGFITQFQHEGRQKAERFLAGLPG